jgi:glutaredoxin
MHKIKVYILENCKSCKRIKELFFNSGYNIDYLNCDNHEEECDFLENLTGNYTYPIIHIESSEKINYVINKSNIYDPLNPFIFLNKNNWIHCRCISVEDMFNKVKKIINE